MTQTQTPTFKIVGSYNGGNYEEIDIAYGNDNRQYLLEEYRMAYGTNWHIAAYRIDE